MLIDWIADSDLYGTYVSLLLTKLEMKSYQQNLSKAMRKGGYFRIGNAGRHIKWLLPGIKLSGDRSDEEDSKDDETKRSKVTEKASNDHEGKKEMQSEEEDENNLQQDKNRTNDIDDQVSDVPIEDE